LLSYDSKLMRIEASAFPDIDLWSAIDNNGYFYRFLLHAVTVDVYFHTVVPLQENG